MIEHAARLALEWWRASGPRTEARLRELARHHAAVLAVDADAVATAALAGRQSWEREGGAA